mgnify:CR=1 FL=1
MTPGVISLIEQHGLTAANELVRFDSGAPASFSVPVAVSGLAGEIGQQVALMWREAAAAWDQHDPGAAAHVGEMDELVNELHARMWAELVEAGLPAEVTMEMALVARFYERLGDHAKHVTDRVTPDRR